MKQSSTSGGGAEFDRFDGAYESALRKAVKVSGRDLAFFTEVKAEVLIDLATRRLEEPARLRVLDLGCGPGLTDAYLVDAFQEVNGVDVSAAMIKEAAARNPSAHYEVFDGTRMPYRDRSFDLAFAINVFHHVALDEREALTRELARVLRPGGLAAIIEHNPLNPVTRRIVSNCAFDEDAVLFGRREAERLLTGAGLDLVERRYLLFVPRRARRLERVLRWVPLGAQFLVAAHAR
jgi:SAM-dependent methyltransferase